MSFTRVLIIIHETCVVQVADVKPIDELALPWVTGVGGGGHLRQVSGSLRLKSQREPVFGSRRGSDGGP